MKREPTKNVSLRIGEGLHKELKYLMIDIDKSLNEYFLDLAKKDIEERKKEQ